MVINEDGAENGFKIFRLGRYFNMEFKNVIGKLYF